MDCNTPGLSTSSSFSVTALGHSGVRTEFFDQERISLSECENRCNFSLEVYSSLRSPFSHPVLSDRFDSSIRSDESWEVLLFDIRMIDPPMSIAVFPEKVNLSSAVVGRHCWRSSRSDLSIDFSEERHSDSGLHQRITSAATDGQRWAVAVGTIAARTQRVQRGIYETSSSTESLERSDNMTSYSFCSVTDLSQGLRATEVCRWPLMLGTAETMNGLGHLASPALIAPASEWRLTEDTETHIWIANSLSQVELIS